MHKLDLENGNKIILKGDKPTLTYWIRENKRHLLGEFYNSITKIVSLDQIIIKETISKTVDIPFPGLECELCKKTLDDKTP